MSLDLLSGFGQTTDQVVVGDRVIDVPKTLVAERKSASGGANVLEEKYLFSKEGGNGIIRPFPQVLHFGGFLLGHIHEQTLQLVNQTSTSQRIHVLPPQTPYFKFHADKKGAIPSGLSETVTIEFVPDEFRYYYDCVRVHAGDDSFIVPIHAYPVVNEVNFPTKVDFGTVAVLGTETRTLSLKCQVPISFDFQLHVLDPVPELEISPLQGTVPANGVVEINVAFRPVRMVTLNARVSLHISQFGWKPAICEFIGSSAAATELSRLQASHMSRASSTKAVMSKHKFLTTLGDLARDIPSTTRSASRDEPPKETVVDGLRIPDNPFTPHAANYILTQEPGKTKIKDLKALLEANAGGKQDDEPSDPKAKARMAIAAYQNRSREFLECDEEWGDELSQQRAEVCFEQERRERVEYERAKEVKWFVALGERLLTEEEVAAVHDKRTARKEASSMARRDIERESVETQMSGGRVCKAMEPALDHTPTYDVYLNDAWRIRKESLGRFVDQVRKVIVLHRVDRRLSALQLLVESDPAAIAAMLDEEASGSGATKGAGGEGDSDATGKSMRVDASNVVSSTFPVYRESHFQDRHPVVVGTVEPFEDWDTVALKVPKHYKMVGHFPLPLPALPANVTREQDRPFRFGAEEEGGMRGSRGDTAQTVWVEACPSTLARAPGPTPSVCPSLDRELGHTTEGTVFSQFGATSEVDPFHSLRQPMRNPTQETGLDVALSSVAAEPVGGLLAGRWHATLELPDCVMGQLPPPLMSAPPKEVRTEPADPDEEEENEAIRPPPPTMAAVSDKWPVGEEQGEGVGQGVPECGAVGTESLRALETEEVERRVALSALLRDRLATLCDAAGNTPLIGPN